MSAGVSGNRAQLAFCVVGICATLACVVLPVMGARGFFAEFRQPYSARSCAILLSSQLYGPVFLILFETVLVYLTRARKRIPLWMGVIAFIGTEYTTRAVGGCSHDFSHVIFEECSDIYGYVIFWLCVSTFLALMTVCVLDHRRQRAARSIPKLLTRKNLKRAAAGLLVLVVPGPWVVYWACDQSPTDDFRCQYLEGASQMADYAGIYILGSYLSWKSELIRRDVAWIEFQVGDDDEAYALAEVADRAYMELGQDPLISWDPNKLRLGFTVPRPNEKWFAQKMTSAKKTYEDRAQTK